MTQGAQLREGAVEDGGEVRGEGDDRTLAPTSASVLVCLISVLFYTVFFLMVFLLCVSILLYFYYLLSLTL